MRSSTDIQPPRWPVKLIRRLIRRQYLEEIEGDLEELFRENLALYSPAKSRRLYAWTALRLLRPILVKKLEGSLKLNFFGMFKHHFKTAIRNFKRDLSYSLINVLGLTLGIACCLVIALWAQNELSYDRFHEKGPNIYQVMRNATYSEGPMRTEPGTAYPIGQALIDQTPEISAFTRVAIQGEKALEIQGKVVEKSVNAVDPAFMEIFSFPLLEGNIKDCLTNPNSMLISESMAQSLFPDDPALGQKASVLQNGQAYDFFISGVFQDPPLQSTLQFDVLIPISVLLPYNTAYESWGNSWMHTYVLMDEEALSKEVNTKVADLPKKMAEVDWFKLNLQPFENGYLYTEYQDGEPVGGRIDEVQLFVAIALFTLIIACFNFVNLTTARSVKRSREVGIKKIMGANRSNLIGQFLLETSLMALLALMVAIIITEASLPLFNGLVSTPIRVNYSDPQLYGLLALIWAGVVGLSGIYPALFISSFFPLKAIKGKVANSLSQKNLMSGLTVLQFTLAMILIAGTLVINSQLSFIQNSYLGFNQDQVLMFDLDAQTYEHSQVMIDQLSQQPGVLAVSASSTLLGAEGIGRTSDPIWDGKSTDESPWFSILEVDYGFLELLDIKLKEGRYFDPRQVSDSLNYIINEKAAALMGMEDPVGTRLGFWGDQGGSIVGIIDDFHFESLHQEVFPMIIRCRPQEVTALYLKLQGGKTAEMVPYLVDLHEQFSSLPLNYRFLDESMQQQYEDDQAIQRLSTIFSILAIVISCLGLLGLAAFSARQRAREVAVRKVLGANFLHLINLLFKRHFGLILLGSIIGIPITQYWMGDWLAGFAYRIDLAWYSYLAPTALIMLLALATVARICIQVSFSNPVNSLRHE